MEPLNKVAGGVSFAEMRQRKGYVWVYWCVARRATGRPEDDDASLVLQAVLSQEIHALEPERAGRQYYGYSAERQSFWLRPNRIDDAQLNTGATNPSLAFYESRPTGREAQAALAEFVGSREFQLWCTTHLRTSTRLSQAQRDALKDIAGEHCRLDWPYKGVLLVGRHAGVLWFGIRDNHGLATLPASDQALRLRRPRDFVRVIDADLSRTPPVDVSVDERVARAIAAVVAGEVEDAPDLRSDASIRFFCASHEFVAVSTLPTFEAETEVFRRTQNIDARSRVLLLARPQVDSTLAHAPWLWSKHQKGLGFAVCRVADKTELQEALLTSPLRQKVPVSDAVSRTFPAVQTKYVRIIGRPGSGKSTAIYHLLRQQFPNALAIITAPHMQPDDAQVVLALIRDAPNLGLEQVVLVFDDLHRYSETTFQHLAPALAEEHVTLLAASWSTEEARISDRFGAWLHNETRINLDLPDASFIAALTTHCLTTLKLPRTKARANAAISPEELAAIFCHRDSTPHGIITRLANGTPLEPRTDDQYWQAVYDALARQRAHAERHVLRALAFLRHAAVPTTQETLGALIDADTLHDVLATLQANGWLLVKDDRIWIDDVQLMPAFRELWHEDAPTTHYLVLLERVLNSFPAAFTCQVLDGAMGALRMSGHHNLVQRGLHVLAQALPTTHPWLAGASLELIRFDPEAGDAGMRRYLAAHPDAVHWWHDWVNAHIRNGDLERAMAVLKDGLLTAPHTPSDDDLLDLTVFLAGTGTHGAAILSMLHQLPNEVREEVVTAIRDRGEPLAQLRVRHIRA